MTFDNVIGDIHATAPDSDWQTAGMQAIRRSVRQASPQDAAGCVAIYRPYVEATAISWEIEVPTVGEMAARITAARKTHEWLILERDDQIGFAYGHAFNRFPAYQWSAETGVYINVDHHRAGGGRKLYTQLLHRLAERGYWRAFAGITQPNEASNGFIDLSGSRMLAYTGASNGNTTAGTTSHGCNSICSELATRKDPQPNHLIRIKDRVKGGVRVLLAPLV
jgi:L-amino acid N-acyltransferase YncA